MEESCQGCGLPKSQFPVHETITKVYHACPRCGLTVSPPITVSSKRVTESGSKVDVIKLVED